MKKYIISAIILILLLSVFVDNLYASTYSGGKGEPSSPYLISTVADWQELMTTSADWNQYFLMTADIDLAGVSLTPIGHYYFTGFEGVFDGNGHFIRNAVINLPSTDFVGLFGFVYFGGQIKNLHVENANITGESSVGGLVGVNSGDVSACYATGSVSGMNSVGGLIGYNYGGLVTACYATGIVTGTYYVGGLVGGNDDAVTFCYATGSVSGSDYVGGLVGYNDYWSNIINCYSTGSVSGSPSVGGLVGGNNGNVTLSFWDMNTSGWNTSDGGTGETTAQMKTLSTFTSAGWDFVNVWKIKENIGYPHLIWENAQPVACIVGGNKTLEAQGPFGARVRLDGSCSSDADSTPGTNDDINDFNWYKVDPCDPDNKILLGKGEIIDCNLPLGKNTVMLEVTDKAGATDSNEITVTVQDTTPPDFKLSVTPNVLWPPNHKMVRITPAWTAHDLVDPSPVVSLVGITSNDNSAAKDDIQINNDGSIYLRAEKDMIYTITYKACDFSGNCTNRSVFVAVPHDNGK